MCWMPWLLDGSDAIAKNASTIHTGAAEGGRAGGKGRDGRDMRLLLQFF